MSEVAFCKQFLSALDARPVKLSSDHIADARQYPAQAAYTLPRLPHPPHPQRPNPISPTQSSGEDAATSGTANVVLKPMKPSSPTVPISSIDTAKTSIFDLKQSYSTSSSIPIAKIKILYKKKPVTDSKTVAEVVGQEAGSDIEFSVMVMGGATSTPVQSPPAVAPDEAEKGLGSASGSGGSDNRGPTAQGPSGKEVVAGSEFWDDLKGFVIQRIRDEDEGQRLVGVFKAAWEKNR